MTTLALGIDIGGTKIAAALVNAAGQIVARERMGTPVNQGADAILNAAIMLGRNLRAAVPPGDEVVAVGVGAAGHIDHACGRVVYAADTLPGWGGAEVGPVLKQALNLPVVVDNDVNAMALGEQQFGAGRQFPNAVYVTVGTGVGGALILSGELWRGTHWAAGELGHLVLQYNGTRRCSCGAQGHLEAYTAGPVLVARYNERGGSDTPLDLRTVAARAAHGDRQAQQIITEGGHMLGIGLGGLLNVLDVQALIIGGGVAELGERWWAALEAALRSNPLPGPRSVALRRAGLGVDAVVIGAAWLALHRVVGSTQQRTS